MKLRYGDPPEPEMCKDLGAMPVPATLEHALDAETQQREIGILDLMGTPLPPWARARFVVRKLEKMGGNNRVRVKDLGTVVVGSEGWEVLE